MNDKSDYKIYVKFPEWLMNDLKAQAREEGKTVDKLIEDILIRALYAIEKY